MKAKYIFLTILIMIIFLAFSSNAMAQPNITGESAILVEAETGKILWGKNEREQRAPASITKLVTALVAIEKGDLEAEVTVSQNAVNTIGSRAWLREGEIKTLENLLYAIMLDSGNDAAIAIAEHIGGTVDNFVEMMNQTARELGAYSSNFTNPTGLSSQGHYSTAYDIALIMKAVLENPILKEMVGTEIREWNSLDRQSNLANTNQLLRLYEGTLGGKTGYTTEAGSCLVNAVARDGMVLISVVLGSNSQNIWSDSTRILDFGYNNFHRMKLVDQGEEILQIDMNGRVVPVLARRVGDYLTSRDSDVLPIQQIKMQHFNLPLQEGDAIGTLEFIVDGEIIESVELVAGINVRRPITLVGVYVVVSLIFFGLVALALLLKVINTLRKRRSSMYVHKDRGTKYGSSRMYQ